jgi:hypothetical protein
VSTVAWTDDSIIYLAAEFDVRTLSKERWTHEAHLIVGTYFVHTYGTDGALRRMRSGICALNDTHGTPNSDTDGYHETITRFFVTAIQNVITRAAATSLEHAVAAVLGSNLTDPEAPLQHWSRETLFSPAARLRWVEPDRQPLPES